MIDKRNRLVQENLKLVPTVIWSKFEGDVSRDPSLLEEYTGVGNLALIKAASRYDESLGYEFSTYACSVIWGEIQRFRRDNKNLIKLPRRLQKAGAQYSRGQSSNKDIDTICEETGIEKRDIEEWLSVNNVVRLDAPINECDNLTGMDMLTDNVDIEESIIEKIKYKEKMEILERILTPREFQVVKLIESGTYLQREIAEELKVSQAHVSRIIRKLTQKVGPALEEYYSGKITSQEFYSMHKYRQTCKKSVV